MDANIYSVRRYIQQVTFKKFHSDFVKFKWNFGDVSKQSTFRLSNSYNIPNCLLQNGQAITPAPAEAVSSQAGAGHLFCLTGSSVRSGVRL